MINYVSKNSEEKFFDKLNALEIECEEDLSVVEELFTEYRIDEFEFKSDCVFDSAGCDVYYYAYAFIVNDKPKLFSGSYTY